MGMQKTFKITGPLWKLALFILMDYPLQYGIDHFVLKGSHFRPGNALRRYNVVPTSMRRHYSSHRRRYAVRLLGSHTRLSLSHIEPPRKLV